MKLDTSLSFESQGVYSFNGKSYLGLRAEMRVRPAVQLARKQPRLLTKSKLLTNREGEYLLENVVSSCCFSALVFISFDSVDRVEFEKAASV